MLLRATAVLLCALVPGAVAWWTGRAVIGRRDDPALAELLLQRRSRLTSVGAVAVAAIVVIAQSALLLVLGIALLVVVLLAGAYPTRRALLGETWDLGTYLWNASRRAVASAGYWVALAVTPQVVLTAPTRWAPWVAAALGLLLALWPLVAMPVWLRVFGATPLADHAAGARIGPRLAEISAASTARPPAVWRIGRPGERLVGAFAILGSRRAGVAFGDALLDLLPDDELAAVYAHEVAHLEHFTPARVRRGRAAGAFLALAAAALPIALRSAMPESTWMLAVLWPLLVVVAMAVRAGRGRSNEIASDLRAAELCGDPEAMVRALVTLHAALLLPRRWPADFERAATHPSLANRVRALRAAAAAKEAEAGAAAATPSLGAPAVLRSTTPGTWVVLDAARVSVLSGVPAEVASDDPAALRERAASVRADAYERLVELRVAAERGGGRALVATDRAGASWRVPLDPADVRAAQAALDVVDVRLASRPTAAGVAASSSGAATRALSVLLPIVLLAGAVMSGQVILVLLAGMLALARAGAAALALLGGTALSSAVVALAWDAAGAGFVTASRTTALGVLLLAVGGSVALLLAWRAARAAGDEGAEPADRSARPAVVAPAVVAALLAAAALVLSVTASPIAALPALRQLAVALAGLGAAVAVGGGAGGRRTARRRLGALFVASSAAAALLPLALPGARAAEGRTISLGRSAPAAEVARVALDSPAHGLRLSPSATRFAVRVLPPRDTALDAYDESWEDAVDEYDADGRSDSLARAAEAYARAVAAARYAVGAFGDSAGAPRRHIVASDLAFVDDDHVLALASHGLDSLALTLEPAAAGGGGPMWETRLPMLAGARLRVATRAGVRTWTVVGREPRTRAAVALTGRIGAAGDVTVRRWPTTPVGLDGVRDAATAGALVPTAAGGSLAVHVGGVAGRRQWLLAVLGAPVFSWEVWRFADTAGGAPRRLLTTRAFVRCAPPHADAGAGADAACVAQDGRGAATVWSLPAGARSDADAMRPIGRVAGWFGEPASGPAGRVALPSADGGSVVLLDAGGSARRLVWPSAAGATQELEWTRGGLARLSSGARSGEVVLYRAP